MELPEEGPLPKHFADQLAHSQVADLNL